MSGTATLLSKYGNAGYRQQQHVWTDRRTFTKHSSCVVIWNETMLQTDVICGAVTMLGRNLKKIFHRF